MIIYNKKYDIGSIKLIDKDNIWHKLSLFKEYSFENKITFWILGTLSIFGYLFSLANFFYDLVASWDVGFLENKYNVFSFYFIVSCFSLMIYSMVMGAINDFIKNFRAITDSELVVLHNKLKNKPDFYSKKTKDLFKAQGFITHRQFFKIYYICCFYEDVQKDYFKKRIKDLENFWANEKSVSKEEFDKIIDIQGFLAPEQIKYFEKEKANIETNEKADEIKKCFINDKQ